MPTSTYLWLTEIGQHKPVKFPHLHEISIQEPLKAGCGQPCSTIDWHPPDHAETFLQNGIKLHLCIREGYIISKGMSVGNRAPRRRRLLLTGSLQQPT